MFVVPLRPRHCLKMLENRSEIGRLSKCVPLFPLQVPRGPQSEAYDSLQPRKCPHCSHYGPIKPNACHDSHSNTTGPRGEAGVGVKAGRSCSSAHQTSHHGAVRCHWLHGSNESGTQKPPQHHVVTVRCVWRKSFDAIVLKLCWVICILKFSCIYRDGGLYCILRKWVVKPVFTLKPGGITDPTLFLKKCLLLWFSILQLLSGDSGLPVGSVGGLCRAAAWMLTGWTLDWSTARLLWPTAGESQTDRHTHEHVDKNIQM